jgi:predicted DNA-binding transcriptional regulator AlpA
MAKLMTDVEVGEMLGLTPQTLRTWRSDGQGPRFAKLGGAVRYDEADVREWIEKRKVEPGKAEEVQS